VHYAERSFLRISSVAACSLRYSFSSLGVR
jgi:hypothetical protein